MKILLLSHVPNDPNGGASRIYHMLSDALRARGHEVNVLHYEDYRTPNHLVARRLADRFAMPQLVSRRAMDLDPMSYDAIMASSGMAYPLFRRLRRHTRRPALVNHLHGLAVFDHITTLAEAELDHLELSRSYKLITGPLQVRWDRAGVDAADVTVVQNLRDVSEVGEMLDGRGEVVMIPAAVHPQILAASQRCAPPEQRRPGAILWLASWGPRKGSYYLPAAYRQIRERRPDATLTVGGTHLNANELRAQFDPQDRESVTVRSEMSIDEHIALMNESSIFLFPSLSEGFGLALVEALCFGLAAVTSSTAFGGDFLTDAVDARIVPISAAHISRAVLDLIENGPERVAIARRGQQLARTFTVDRMAIAYEQAYQAAIDRRR